MLKLNSVESNIVISKELNNRLKEFYEQDLNKLKQNFGLII